MAEGVLFDMAKTLLESMGQSAFQEVSSWCGARTDLKKLQQTLELINSRVIDAEKRHEGENSAAIKVWLRRLRTVLYKAEDLLDDVFTVDQRKQRMQGSMVKKVRLLFSSSSPLLFNIQVAREIKSIRQELEAIKSDMDGLNLSVCDHREDSHFPMAHLMNKRETTSFVEPDGIVGRDDAKNEIINMLFDPKCADDRVSVIPIVGFGGIGKTTLAQLVFNDERVKSHFEVTKWACVPEVDNLNEVKRIICSSFTGMQCHDTPLEQLESRITESISNKKYLLVLDDIWDDSRDRWLDLVGLLKCGSKGSKIIVTTRSDVVAAVVATGQSYKLGLLKNEDSWRLFKRLAFKEGQEEANPNFTRIGEDIVSRCANVPLAIRVIGSLLYSKSTEQEWSLFRDGHLAKTMMTEQDKIMPVLKLSYDFLPSPLKQCFAYCSLFIKDYRFKKNELVHLWMAQGYIKPSKESFGLEEVGDLYFLELLRRNFFQVAYEDDTTNDVFYKMHDLLHDLALHVTSDEIEDIAEDKTISVYEGTSSSSLVKAKLRSSIIDKYIYNPNLTSMVSSFVSLRVLQFETSEKTLPDCIGRLRHLRYLNLQFSSIDCLPDAITKLENLQTLKLDHCWSLKQLPRYFTKLASLRHLGISGCDQLVDMPSEFGKMRSLRELNKFVVGKSNGLDALATLDLRGDDLEIKFVSWRENIVLEARRVNLKGNQQLLQLTLDLQFQEEDVTPASCDMESVLDCLMFPPNLKAFKVDRYRGEMFPSRVLEQLPYLLPKLVSVTISFCKSIRQVPRFSSLPHLKFLELIGLDELEYIEQADGGGDEEPCFPVLEKMTLTHVPKLKGWWSSPGVTDEFQVQQREMMVSQSHEDLTLHQLPVVRFPRLSDLFIYASEQLVSIPMILPRLEYLRVSGIHEKLMEYLVSPHYQEAPSIPSSSSATLSTLKTLEIQGIYNLVSFPIKFYTLESLRIIYCNELTSLTAVSPNSSIRFMCLNGCASLKNVCYVLQHLLALEELEIIGCEELDIWEITTWPDLRSLRSLKVDRISKFQVLPSGIGCLRTLCELKLQYLENVTTLPEEIGKLSQLRDLEIEACDMLALLPQSFCNLSSLQNLKISYCGKLASLPQSFGNLSSLQYLQFLICDELASLPQSFGNLSSLQLLRIVRCDKLASLPQSFCNLSSLQRLWIHNCPILGKRCQQPNGEDWPLIHHIPTIDIRWLR